MSRGKKIFWGVFLILGAVCIFLDSIGKLPQISFLKLLFTIILIALIVGNIVKFSIGGILIPAAFLMCLYRKDIALRTGFRFNPWIILIVAVLLSMGLNLLIRKNT